MNVEIFKKRINRIKRICKIIESTMDDSFFEGKEDYLRSLMMLSIPENLLRIKRSINVLCKYIKL